MNETTLTNNDKEALNYTKSPDCYEVDWAVTKSN